MGGGTRVRGRARLGTLHRRRWVGWGDRRRLIPGAGGDGEEWNLADMFGINQGVVPGVRNAGHDIAAHGCYGGGGELDELDLTDDSPDTDDPDELFGQNDDLLSTLIGGGSALLALVVFFVEIESAYESNILQLGTGDGREFREREEGEKSGGGQDQGTEDGGEEKDLLDVCGGTAAGRGGLQTRCEDVDRFGGVG